MPIQAERGSLWNKRKKSSLPGLSVYNLCAYRGVGAVYNTFITVYFARSVFSGAMIAR
jgi:hypothetical protein